MLVIDGSQGEGGGQILRSSLSLSLITRTPFRIERIRAGRDKPGLQRQHLAAVRAAAAVGSAEIEGDSLGSQNLVFRPGMLSPGRHRFSTGGAGSTLLVLQTVLPPLLTAGGPSQLSLEGGTHNIFAPPFDFVAKTFLPLVNRMGPTVSATLDRHGFFPGGGGAFHVEIQPAPLRPIRVLTRGPIKAARLRALLAGGLPRHIAERELSVAARKLPVAPVEPEIEEIRHSAGPGNVLMIELESDGHTEVFTGFGEKGVRAEAVAESAVAEARAYLDHGAPVGEHLADQLLLPMALAGGGAFLTGPLSRHAATNIEVIERFLPVSFAAIPGDDGTVRVECGPRE